MFPLPAAPVADRLDAEPWIDDTAAFNRWLCISRVRASVAIAVFFPALAWFGLIQLRPLPVILACSLQVATSIVALRPTSRLRTSRIFLHSQMLVDIGVITAGIGFAATGSVALMARLLYVVSIVPASLISVRFGCVAALVATLGHAILLLLERGAHWATFASFDFLGPAFLFAVVTQQTFVYGAHLRAKNDALVALASRLDQSQRRLAEEGRAAAGLVEIARTLSASLDDPEPLARVVGTIRERLHGDWVALFGVESSGFRLLATTDAEVAASGVGRFELPLASWPVVGRLAEARTLVLSEGELASLPTALTASQAPQGARLAALYRDGGMIGFLAVGYRAEAWAEGARATHLLAGIAEHASVVVQNARLLEEVRAASALKSEFVGAVSHELRSPLNVILGYLEMLLDRALGPLTLDQLDALRRVEVHAATLLEMIEALLDLNRIEAGRLPLEIRRFSLAVLLNEVCDSLERTFSHPSVELRREIPRSLPPLETDPGKLKTIVRNLVHNALKFTTEGHVAVRATALDEQRVAIVVEDTGCGIPASALGYVFDMFRQVPGSGGGGVGLGLHIVRRLSDAIGATVEVRSEVGHGTRFTLTLAAAAVASPADAHAA